MDITFFFSLSIKNFVNFPPSFLNIFCIFYKEGFVVHSFAFPTEFIDEVSINFVFDVEIFILRVFDVSE